MREAAFFDLQERPCVIDTQKYEVWSYYGNGSEMVFIKKMPGECSLISGLVCGMMRVLAGILERDKWRILVWY